VPHRESDQQYFSRRHDEESAAAETAANAGARLAHLELAARYAQLAAAIREVEERLGVGPATMPAATVNPAAESPADCEFHLAQYSADVNQPARP